MPQTLVRLGDRLLARLVPQAVAHADTCTWGAVCHTCIASTIWRRRCCPAGCGCVPYADC